MTGGVNTWILLLRGVNVGGRNILPMQILRRTLTGIGLADVRTYIQSGNAVFRSRHRSVTALRRTIVDAIVDAVGFGPETMLLSPAALREAIDSNPYRDDMSDPRRSFVFFLAARPGQPDLAALERLKGPGERFALIGEVLYLDAPNGLARSKLGAGVDKALGVAATARNWRTVNKLADMAGVQPAPPS